MDTLEIFQRLTLALAIGLLIGLERGWQAREEPEGERAAGLRTFALAGLLGGLWGAIATHLPQGGILLGLAFAVFGGTIVLFRYREVVHDKTFGATTAVAALVAFALGAYALLGDKTVAGAADIIVTGLLAIKGVLHSWLRRLTWPELRSGLVLLAMTFVALPVLPNHPVDPLGAFNPFEIWLLTVLLAVISFAGYVATKLAGSRHGIALTGLAGGLASSTAATLMMARLAREHPTRQMLLSGGAMLAGAVMMMRVIVTVGIVEPTMLAALAIPLALATATMGAAAYLSLVDLSSPADKTHPLQLSNPLDLEAVLKFGALLTVVGVLARLAGQFAGDTGVYVLAAFSGVADVDAISLSMARLSGDSLSHDVAARAILLAVAVNTLAKAVMAALSGGRGIGVRLGIAGIAAIAAGALAHLFLPPIAIPLPGSTGQ